MRLGIDLAGSLQPRDLFRCEHDADLVGDFAGDLALHGQDVAQVAFVAFRPQMLIALRVYQLCRDADTLARAQHRAFEHRVDVQLARDAGQGFSCGPVWHDRRTRDDA